MTNDERRTMHRVLAGVEEAIAVLSSWPEHAREKSYLQVGTCVRMRREIRDLLGLDAGQEESDDDIPANR